MSGRADTRDSTTTGERILVVSDRSLSPHAARALRDTAAGRIVMLLDLSPDEHVTTGEVSVERLRIDALLDLDRFHAELIQFLDNWPRETRVDGRPFGDVFRQTTGDSLWWTGPGSQRHPYSGPIVPVLRDAWLVHAAISHHNVECVTWHVSDRERASVLPAVCAAKKVGHLPLPGSARPLKRLSIAGLICWRFAATASLIAVAMWIVIRSLYARVATRSSSSSVVDHAQPTLVMSGWYPHHVHDDVTGRPQVVYWQRLTEELRRQCPEVDVRYLMHTTTFRVAGSRKLLRPFVTGWSRLRRLDGVLPLAHCYPQLRTYLSAARHQYRTMRTYEQFEHMGGLQSSPRFAGADVSWMLAPHLRRSVATMARWSRNVAATAASLKSAGSVCVVLVHEEFYPKGMLTIAAARMLGVPTMGVQHGLIGPQHTVYMLPQGQIDNAPTPDWFAAYGEYAAAVLSEAGAFPPERIRVVGAPRFDELVTSPLGRRRARAALNWRQEQVLILLTTETFRLSSPLLRALLPVADDHPDWRIVVKLHPHERHPDAYAQLVHGAGASNVEVVWERLPEWMAACDVLVTGYSTTAIEALLLGTPVVCADLTTSPDRYPFVGEGAARPARSDDELRRTIVAILDDSQRAVSAREFLTRHLGPTARGRAAEAFAATIRELFIPEADGIT